MTDRRHWNGSVGDRHEHQNVWLRGGVRGPAVTSPWAGWDAYRRRVRSHQKNPPYGFFKKFNTELLYCTQDSESSIKSLSSNSNSRRSSSSSSSGTLFTTLTHQKRSSTDPDLSARRKSYSEQSPTRPGFLSSWWRGYTRGY